MISRGRLRARAINTAVIMWKAREPFQRGIEEPDATAQSAATHVMVCRRQLDQTLQVLLDIGFRGEPDLFPRLVCFPELEGVEMFDSASEKRCEIRFHGFSQLTAHSSQVTMKLL